MRIRTLLLACFLLTPSLAAAQLPVIVTNAPTISDPNVGTSSDAAVTGDNPGTLIGHIRYLDKAFADIWDPTNHLLKFKIVLPNGTDVTYLCSLTESATETVCGAVQGMSAYLKGYDGTSAWLRLRARGGAIGASDNGLVVRPFVACDGTNCAPTMDAPARAGFMSPAAAATGGATAYSTGWSTAAVFTAQIKGSAGTLSSLTCFNNTNTKKYGRLYDQTGAPASTDTANIVFRFLIPADVASNGGSGFTVPLPVGKNFATGIGIRLSGAVADNDATALVANDVVCNGDYK